MNTRFALLGATLAGGLVAFTLPVDDVTFHVEEGKSLTKSFSTEVEFSLDDLIITMNGQEIDPAMMGADFDMSQATGTFGYTLAVTDEYTKMNGAKPSKLKRKVETLNAEYEMGTGDSGSESADVEGHTVVFDWNEEEGGYTRSLEGEGDVDEDEYQMLAEDLDLRALLPGKAVSEGDSWTVSGAALAGILMPGLDVSKAVARAQEEGGDDMPFEIQEFVDKVTESAVLKCTYAGTREVDGVSLQVIDLESEFEENLDFTDLVLEAMEGQMPPEVSLDLSIVMVLGAKAEGQMLWNGAAGHFHTMNLDMEMLLALDASGSADMGGQEQSGGVEAEVSLHMTREASAR